MPCGTTNAVAGGLSIRSLIPHSVEATGPASETAMKTILVISVRGKTGRQVAAALARQQWVQVRGAGRNVTNLTLPGAHAVHFDWEDPASWNTALNGVSAIYLVKPKTPDPASTVTSFLQLAGEAKRVVLLSEIGCESRDDSTDERRVEKAVEATSLDWTILRPNWFMQNFAEPNFYLEAIRDKGELMVPTGGQPVSFIDTRDIADVAAAALMDSSHAMRAYTLTGPEALTFAEVATRIAEIAGHQVRHSDPPLADYLSGLTTGGVAKSNIEYYRRIYAYIQNGQTAPVSTEVEQVSGHQPRTFSAFVVENKSIWHRYSVAP